MTDYITPSQLEARLEKERESSAGKGYLTAEEADARVAGKIEAYDKEKEKKDKEKEEELVSEWKGWVPTELNVLKSEFTALKAEWVPLNASLPSFFSLEEYLKKKFSLEYNDYGLLLPQTDATGEERPGTQRPGTTPATPTTPTTPATPTPATNPSTAAPGARNQPARTAPGSGRPAASPTAGTDEAAQRRLREQLRLTNEASRRTAQGLGTTTSAMRATRSAAADLAGDL
ncbi:hypothetical protein [Streptomyces sp. NPDC048438]|uniref:hypothetical protein n=1 Tax=Streptomyces sp. NPDC048438 TaxID=3365551 RepID=UPI003715229A